MTHYDEIKKKINNMSLDELVDFLNPEYCEQYCVGCENCKSCENGIRKWLKQSAKPTLSEAERVILENIDKDYNWIARDNVGYIYIFIQ